MIDVAVTRRHPAAREHAGPTPRFDVTPLRRGRSAACGARAERLARLGIGDGVAPFGVRLLVGNLTGDVGDNGSESVEVSGVVSKAGQCVEVCSQMYYSSRALRVVSALEEVEIDIGSQLVHGACLAVTAERSSDPIDAAGRCCDTVWRQIGA